MSRPIVFCLCCIFSFSMKGQYKALEINLNFFGAIEETKEEGLFFAGDSFLPVQKSIGYSMPLNKKILITPKIGVAEGIDRHTLNSNFVSFDSLIYQQDSTIIIKKNRTNYIKIGIESTYWFSSDYQYLFFSGELQGLYNTSAISTTDTWKRDEKISIIEVDYKDKVRKFVPSMRLGAGVNFAVLKFINFYISSMIEIRPSSYFYDVKNYSIITRGVKIGAKLVLGGKSLWRRSEKEVSKSLLF